ncbi:MAG: M81 family metallopeptidase, partial [Delftia sp.]|nr:M81 family metallopeptidase [Delftia sp.]
RSAALACLWDPGAVSRAMSAGVGAQLVPRSGGKIGPMSGDPLDLRVEVIGVQRDATQTFGPDEKGSLGDTVAVRADGIDIVLNTRRTQTLSPECFSNVGIDPQARHILVVKSSQHFQAEFAPIAAETFYVAAPGAINPDFARLPYQHARRNIWPLVEDPV